MPNVPRDADVSTKGEVNRHSSSALVEGRNRILQETAAALAVVAIGDDDDIKLALHGELVNWANVLINFSPVTTFQRQRDITAFQEQTGGS